MDENRSNRNSMMSHLCGFAWKCLFGILSMGPIPDHIAFIMDGNRRYAKKNNLEYAEGHKLGFSALMSMLKYCYELHVKYVTVYAFSIDNFRRSPEEVRSLMALLEEKMDSLIEKNSLLNQYGVRVHFIGDLKLLDESVRLSAERVVTATAGNSRAVLSVCIAYTSTNEIANAVQQSCKEKWDELELLDSCGAAYGLTDYSGNGNNNSINLVDVENHMLMKVAPSPDIVIRTSGESRLSNFLLWQSAHSILYSPSALWPEIGLRHLVWSVLEFQRRRHYLEKIKKQL